jgi:hypothetical protein
VSEGSTWASQFHYITHTLAFLVAIMLTNGIDGSKPIIEATADYDLPIGAT